MSAPRSLPIFTGFHLEGPSQQDRRSPVTTPTPGHRPLQMAGLTSSLTCAWIVGLGGTLLSALHCPMGNAGQAPTCSEAPRLPPPP